MTILRSVLASIIVSASSVLMISTSDAQTAERTFSQATAKDMNKALGYIAEKKYSKAEKKLKDVRKLKGLSAYEISTVEQMLGTANYETGDLDDAAQHYQNAISAGGLLPGEALALERNIAQLLIVEGKHADGATRMENWVRKTGSQDAKSVKLLMQAWMQAENYPKARPWAERWYATTPQKTLKDYDLMNYLYHQLGQKEAQLKVLGDITKQFPQDRKYFDQQVSLLSAAGRDQEAYQVYAGMYDRGLLTDDKEILKVIQFHEYYKNFGKAAQIMETALNNRQLKTNDDNLSKLEALKQQAGVNP